jgi:erythromycin esterase
VNQTAGKRRKNVKNITAAAILVFALLGTPVSAVQRHRATRPPVSDDTPAGWLLNHAYPYVEAIGPLAGPATVIGLGDDTHGTHEYWATKLRMIETLVRDDGFTLIGFEGPFPDFSKLDDYALGGDGDPRAILRHHELGYWFWASEEIVAAIEWIRNYNLTRGDRPAVEIAGFDVTDSSGAAAIVTTYLDAADSAAAANARSAYADCVTPAPQDCPARLQAIVDDLALRETELVSRTSQHAYDRALHAAHIVAAAVNESPATDSFYHAWRDENMAKNALSLRQRMTANGRMVLWAHHEHIGKTTTIENAKSMGKWLDEQLGSSYFALGTCTGTGSFNVVLPPAFVAVSAVNFPPASSVSYESSFASAGMPLMLIPLHGALPDWLATQHHLRGGTSGAPYDKMEVLPQKFDAILYIDRTTPSTSFW